MSEREGSSPAAGRPAADDYEEISLVDVVRVLHARRLILAATLVLALVAGGAFTAFATPQFEASATVIPLAHDDIIRSWFDSRQAAELVAGNLGNRLIATMYPDDWDASAEAWRGAERSDTRVAQDLQDKVSVSMSEASRATGGNVITVTVTLPDAVLARDAAAAYVDTLDDLRPRLVDIERNERFERHYDGENEQEAQRRAQVAAEQKDYWIVFDDPTVPSSASSPRPALNMALSGVLGVMLGVMLVFTLEWLRQYRAEFQRVEGPVDQTPPAPVESAPRPDAAREPRWTGRPGDEAEGAPRAASRWERP